MSKINKWLLVLVLTFAAFIRLFQINKIPVALFGDEIDVGYQAWSLGTTGRDYTGNLLPTFLHSFSEWRTPLLSYVLSPVLAVFGPSVYSVRVPVALMGVLNIYLVFLLFQKLFPKSKKFSLLAAFLLSVSPWHIHFSRIAFDSTLLLNLYLFSSLLILNNKFALSLPVLILTLYTYPTANIFTPLFIVAAYFILRPQISLRKDLFLYILTVILIIPISMNIITGSASGRFGNISIFNDPKLVDSVIVSRTETWVLGKMWEPIFHNKPIVFLNTFISQYISAFSTNFLFVSGDPNFRHSVGDFGEFYFILAPLFFIGFYSLISRLSDPKAKFLLLWVLLAPVPAALTQGGGSHAIRLITLLPALIIIFTLAVADTADILQKTFYKKLFLGVLVTITLFSLVVYWHRYSDHYRYQSARIWQYGYEQVFTDLAKIDTKGKVYINNTYEPSLLKFLFFTKYPPKQFFSNFKSDKTVTDIVPGFSGFVFADKYYFGQINKGYDMSKLLLPGDLYLAAQLFEIPGDQDWSKQIPVEYRLKSLVRNFNNEPLFTLFERK